MYFENGCLKFHHYVILLNGELFKNPEWSFLTCFKNLKIENSESIISDAVMLFLLFGFTCICEIFFFFFLKVRYKNKLNLETSL